LGQSRLPALRGTPGAGTVTATSAGLGANSSSSLGSSSSPGMSFNAGPGFKSDPAFGSGSSFGSTTDPNAQSMLDLTRAGWSNTA
jgi:hypothetical protein